MSNWRWNRSDRIAWIRKATIIQAGLIVFLLAIMTPVSAYGRENDKDDNEEKGCLDCHEEFQKELSGEFNHTPFEEGECEECHAYHEFRNVVELKAPPIELCSRCHEEMTEISQENIHDPLTEDEGCILCHDPHSSEHEHLLLEAGGGVCLECHEGPEDAEGNLHPPFGDSNCTACHDPHGSIFEPNLQMPAVFICLSCHDSVFTGPDPVEMHSADDYLICEQCHMPHYSRHDGLLRQDQISLCTSCHEDYEEIGESPGFHSAIDQEGCTGCHNPHETLGEELLPSDPPDLCFTCHESIREKIASHYPHGAAEEDCADCHTPHERFESENDRDLCGECHELEDEDFETSHFNIRPNGCVTCHDPHGSNNEMMILPVQHPPFEERECGECHQSGNEVPALCMECHDDLELTGAHEPARTTNQTCIGCHSPHATARPHLLTH